MTQPAQSSGHEWAATSAGDKKFTVVCRCGAHLEADADAMIAAHVASVAQAAPQEQVHFCHDNVCTDRPLRKHPCHAESCPERLDASYPVAHPNLAPVTREWVVATEKQLDADTTAQPQEVPAEQRLPTIDELIERWEGYYAAFTSPYYDVSEAPDAMKGLRQCIDELKAIKPHLAQPASAAKPPAEELETQSVSVDAVRRACGRFCTCATYEDWKGLTTNMNSLFRTHQAAREGELRDKVLEEAAQVIDECNREGPYNAIQGARRIRALIAAQRGK